ncbi:elongation factor G [Desulfosalsimonas propionicica]|uniref:Elongation factor G n=1 Tax=Desulfosalsimonas propionicica TaxID=332175 RepID=A0A7W0HJX6_9BACT|nr:elongation factor G [Desulfosalsimonas propionicica]MBA2880655.1 elongation factor G [Desulfosalsimonas propionicica]
MTEHLRNIALIGHGGSGKTSLAEALLHNAGATKRFGSVDAGNAVMDFEPEELKRRSSISTAFYPFSWKQRKINLIDTPGDQNFFSDTRLCMQAADSAVVVIDAVDGIKVQSEQAWEYADEFDLPRVIFINKVDRERADFSKAFNDAVEIFSPKPIILQLPIGQEADFKGVVDLVNMKAWVYEDGKAKGTDIPADMQETAEAEREVLIENIAEADDELVEKYLEGETLSDEEILAALRKGTLEKAFVPVMCGSATLNIGVDLVAGLMADALPCPADRGPKTGYVPGTENEESREPSPDAPFSALVFKTVADPYAGRLNIFRVFSGKLGGDGTFFNATKDTKERYNQLLQIQGKEQKPLEGAGPGDIVAVAKLKETVTGNTLCAPDKPIEYKPAEPLRGVVSFAISPKSKGDEDKIYSSLTKLIEEDPGLRLERNDETRQTLLTGQGQVHIETTVEKLRRKYNVEVNLNIPKVPYKETFRKKVRVQGKHKKQSGGHGQYGDCWVEFEPLERSSGYQFVDKIVGGVIPKTYIPAVDKGIAEASQKGVLAGFPCIDFQAKVDDGSYHSVDSSEMAFKIAGSLAFKKAMEQADPVLLEPIMEMEVITPEEYMGDIMGDLNSRRGRVLGMESRGKNQVVRALVPQAEVLTYAPDLRSMTGGRGMFSMQFSHYDEVPAQISQKVIEELRSQQEQEK